MENISSANNNYPSNQKYTTTSQIINEQITFIYQHLIKLGYPKVLQLSLTTIKQIESYLSTYFQSTSSRLQLIQWLIAIINPQYRQFPSYITEKDPINKLIQSIWKCGVMPLNKHTKNLDYKKYLQGMLGYQNAVQLIYNLTELAYQSVLIKKSKQDVTFGSFFHEIIDNYTELVNQNYDIYGITWPCKFINVNNNDQALSLSLSYLEINEQKQLQNNQLQYLNEFQKQYQQFYQSKMITLLQAQDQLFDKIYKEKNKKQNIQSSRKKNYKKNEMQKSEYKDLLNKQNLQQNGKKNEQMQNQIKEQPNDQQKNDNLGTFIQKLNKYGSQYNDKYNKLTQKIQSLLQNSSTKSRLMPYYLSKKQQEEQNKNKNNNFDNKYSENSVKQNIQNRSVKISPQFCSKYLKYKKIIRQIKISKDDKQFMNQRTQILQQLYKINEEVSL